MARSHAIEPFLTSITTSRLLQTTGHFIRKPTLAKRTAIDISEIDQLQADDTYNVKQRNTRKEH